MGFSFLQPLFLVGLAALAIPVLVHLVQSHRSESIRFPSLMFLERISFKTLRRSKIRNLLLFLMRALAFTLLVLAFARPIMGGGREVIASTGARDVFILLDGSYSMSYEGRWERARATARRAIEALGRGDRAGIILFDDGAELIASLTGDRVQLRNLLESLTPGDRTTRYEPALDLARQALEESERPRREVILISDLQRSGWRQSETPRLPSWLGLTPVDLSEPNYHNVAVSSVQLNRRTESGDPRLILTARIVNRGTRPLDDLEVTLEIDGVERGSKVVGVGAKESGSVTFDEIPIPGSETRGTVSITGDRMAGDNTFRFVLSSNLRLPVLIIENTGARDEQSLYIQRALSIGDRPAFTIEVAGEGVTGTGDLEGRSLVVLNGASAWGVRNADELHAYVEQGGGLFVVLGEAGRRGGRSDNRVEALMPATGSDPFEVPESRGCTLGEIDYDHPVFELFREPHSGDFTAARFYRYHRLEEGWEGRVIAQFDDGSPALLEKRIGNGRILVWTSTFDNYWNDLALQPVFLPFIHQIARYAIGYSDLREWYTVGESLEFTSTGASADEPIHARSPAGERINLTGDQGNPLMALEEAGFYELEDLPDGWEGPRTLAVNRDREESDLEPLDVEEFMLAVFAGEEVTERAGLESTATAEVREKRQSLWWYLLLAVGLLMGIEMITANRLTLTGAT